MSDELTFVQGDTAPPIRATLKRKQDDGTYTVMNLTTEGVTGVRFQMRKVDDVRYQVDAEADIENAASGKVRYEWQDNDLAIAGDDFIGQWELTFAGGKTQTTAEEAIVIRRQ